MRSRSTMKSEEAVMPDAKKPDQSVGRGVKITLSPSRRMNTSRTESGNRYSRGMVTVCERLFHPTRAVGLGVGFWCIAMYQSIWLLSPYGLPYVKWHPTLRYGFGLAGTSGWSVNELDEGSHGTRLQAAQAFVGDPGLGVLDPHCCSQFNRNRPQPPSSAQARASTSESAHLRRG